MEVVVTTRAEDVLQWSHHHQHTITKLYRPDALPAYKLLDKKVTQYAPVPCKFTFDLCVHAGQKCSVVYRNKDRIPANQEFWLQSQT